jgi:hypothetical protein
MFDGTSCIDLSSVVGTSHRSRHAGFVRILSGFEPKFRWLRHENFSSRVTRQTMAVSPESEQTDP